MASSLDASAPEMVVRSVFKKYDKDGNGTIAQRELRELLMDLGFYVAAEDIPVILKEIDENGRGTIEMNEFTTWWRSNTRFATLQSPQALERTRQAASYFKYFDQDKCGMLSKAEFTPMYADLLKNKLVPASISADVAFKTVDRNNSGQVSFNEFMVWLNTVQSK